MCLIRLAAAFRHLMKTESRRLSSFLLWFSSSSLVSFLYRPSHATHLLLCAYPVPPSFPAAKEVHAIVIGPVPSVCLCVPRFWRTLNCLIFSQNLLLTTITYQNNFAFLATFIIKSFHFPLLRTPEGIPAHQFHLQIKIYLLWY